jgi:hypothetical protein
MDPNMIVSEEDPDESLSQVNDSRVWLNAFDDAKHKKLDNDDDEEEPG